MTQCEASPTGTDPAGRGQTRRGEASRTPLAERYDVALLDLDGVVYRGGDAVAGAVDAIAGARARGMRFAFVTNNASRSPATVAAHLRDLGVAADDAEVVTSAQAAARLLAERLAPGSPVLVLGTDALRDEVTGRGLRVVPDVDAGPVAVVQGHSPDTGWRDLAEAAVAVERGALWVATNLDPTLPSPRGPVPGNGTMVNAVRVATGSEPLVAGKPRPALHRESVDRTGAIRPLVVGDRLDTDIEGAALVGCDSLLVLTGVTTPADALRAEPRHRPTYLAADLTGLLAAHPVLSVDARYGDWRARAEADALVLAGSGDPVDALRALCAAWWRRGGSPVAPPVHPRGPAAAAAIGDLGLARRARIR